MGTWECNERDADYVCPGYFNTYCPEGNTPGWVCGCAGEVWMTPDCRELYICEKAASGPDFEFEGDIFSCPEGQLVSVEFGEEITYQCVDETLETSCPSAFNIGCNGDYTPPTTDAPPSTSTLGDNTTPSDAPPATSTDAPPATSAPDDNTPSGG